MQKETPTRDYLADHYIVPAAKAMRAQAIRQMTDAGIWVEQAEYVMDTLFSADPPSFETFLDQHSSLALALWPPRAKSKARRAQVDLQSPDQVSDTDRTQ